MYMAYQISAFSMTLSDLQGHSPTASFFKYDFVQLCSGPSAIAELLVFIASLQ